MPLRFAVFLLRCLMLLRFRYFRRQRAITIDGFSAPLQPRHAHFAFAAASRRPAACHAFFQPFRRFSFDAATPLPTLYFVFRSEAADTLFHCRFSAISTPHCIAAPMSFHIFRHFLITLSLTIFSLRFFI